MLHDHCIFNLTQPIQFRYNLNIEKLDVLLPVENCNWTSALEKKLGAQEERRIAPSITYDLHRFNIYSSLHGTTYLLKLEDLYTNPIILVTPHFQPSTPQLAMIVT